MTKIELLPPEVRELLECAVEYAEKEQAYMRCKHKHLSTQACPHERRMNAAAANLLYAARRLEWKAPAAARRLMEAMAEQPEKGEGDAT